VSSLVLGTPSLQIIVERHSGILEVMHFCVHQRVYHYLVCMDAGVVAEAWKNLRKAETNAEPCDSCSGRAFGAALRQVGVN
jgi:hypothetical protein